MWSSALTVAWIGVDSSFEFFGGAAMQFGIFKFANVSFCDAQNVIYQTGTAD